MSHCLGVTGNSYILLYWKDEIKVTFIFCPSISERCRVSGGVRGKKKENNRKNFSRKKNNNKNSTEKNKIVCKKSYRKS